jgi:sec-independent protein translocase protein TatC
MAEDPESEAPSSVAPDESSPSEETDEDGGHQEEPSPSADASDAPDASDASDASDAPDASDAHDATGPEPDHASESDGDMSSSDDSRTDPAPEDPSSDSAETPHTREPAGQSDASAESVPDTETDSETDSETETDSDSDLEPWADKWEENLPDSEPGEPQPEASPPTEGFEDLDGGLVGDGPESDEEMPLADHIEEMVRRLAVVLVIGGVVGLAVFPVADQIINYLWNSHIPGAAAVDSQRRPRLYGPLELLLTELKVAALAGFVVGLPIAVYETYLFMRPGLFPRERRYYLAAIPTSLVLALIGVGFAHFVVLPAIFAYFTIYTEESVELVAFGLKETFGLILVLMGYMAVVFQIPLFIMLAIMMNLTTREWLEGRRLLFWGGFLGVSFLVSPDPTGMAPIIVAATMITLFEGTLALLRWTGN